MWKRWSRPEDVPSDLRRLIHEGAFVPLLDPDEARALRETILETFCEVLDIYLEENELRWRLGHVHRARPSVPMEAVFHAVGLEMGISPFRLRTIWFVSRRKSRVKELVSSKLKEKVPA